MRIPVSTYRVQFNSTFTFKDAADLTDYFNKLGIGDIYSSPILQSRSGSIHGYDIIDYSKINPELGTEGDFEQFAGKLKQANMGLLLDIVPNHMCIGDPGNQWWQDVLENGRSSSYAKYFDIDWDPPKQVLINKVLLPILDQPYGTLIESRQISVTLENGAFMLCCPYRRLPLSPKSWKLILAPAAGNAAELLSEEDPGLIELRSILFSLDHLPGENETDPELLTVREREKAVIGKRLEELLRKSAGILSAINKQIDSINGKDNPSSDFSALEQILQVQAYRLSYWRVANEEINYRRFFDINDLAGIRPELEEVFEQVHEVVLKFIANGWITGLRVDHVDGLFDPEQYFFNLHMACIKASPGSEKFYVIAEKILTGDEKLPSEWLIHGTTGYGFMNLLNGIFVDPQGGKPIQDIYVSFTEDYQKFSKVIYEAKELILYVALAAELHVLARLLDRIAQQHRSTRDFTQESLRSALRSVIACFPVYRSYIRSKMNLVHDRDKLYVAEAIKRAKIFNPSINELIFDFIRSVLFLKHPDGLSDQDVAARDYFVMRFQQLTGPVMAKGVEDTAFYRTYPMASLNEVGGDPVKFGIPLEKFHEQNQYKLEHWPHSLLSTSTHDSKRSEDVRARINVLSEIPEQWGQAVLRWNGLNKKLKSYVDEEQAPDNHVEYFIYQTLIGTWPLELLHFPLPADLLKKYADRLVNYMNKAMKEAKLHTSWVNPNQGYDQAIEKFVRNLLDPSASSSFLADFSVFILPVINWGLCNSLSQIVLKSTSPGIPDFYQGCELWNFRLVDPDNRQPVDFQLRKNYLEELLKESDNPLASIKKMTLSPFDGKIKLFITHQCLLMRNKYALLFAEGAYSPVQIQGGKSAHIIGFMREKDHKKAVALASRFYTKLGTLADPESFPWSSTALSLPEGRYRDIFTGLEHETKQGTLAADAVFRHLPIAILESL